MNLTSQLRHLLTYLAGIGTALVGWHLIAPEQVAEVNAAGAQMVEPLVVIIGAVGVFVFRLALGWLSKSFSGGRKTARGTELPVWVIACTAAVLMGGLPSCTATGGLGLEDVRFRTASGHFTWTTDGADAPQLMDASGRPNYGIVPTK